MFHTVCQDHDETLPVNLSLAIGTHVTPRNAIFHPTAAKVNRAEYAAKFFAADQAFSGKDFQVLESGKAIGKVGFRKSGLSCHMQIVVSDAYHAC